MFNPQLETFIAAASSGSFAKAAEQLYLTPTAVMKQINNLERLLSVALFRRTNRGLLLTEAGESFLQDARYMVEYFERAVLKAKEADACEKTQVHTCRRLRHDACEICSRRLAADTERYAFAQKRASSF
ncbi:MAG: LysR family transcriptional regulator [Clostridia bacterium]|nr:LysR family transcriptional regulator [Clostridia bacterium]